jgi:F0F1-type ATP synthase assembly protein I
MDMPLEPRKPRDPDGPMASLVKAESLMQLAFLLPAAVFIGWIAGVGLDHLFHTNLLYIAGLILGAVAGFTQMVRIVKRQM